MESYRSAQRIWVIEERISPKSEAIFEKFKNCQFSSIANLRLGFGNWELVSAGKSFNSKIFPHVIPLLNSQNYGVKWEATLNMFLIQNHFKRPSHDVLACTCLMKTISAEDRIGDRLGCPESRRCSGQGEMQCT